MRTSNRTIMIALLAFTDRSHKDADKVIGITPDKATRFAFDAEKNFEEVQISEKIGPQHDGLIELVDAQYFADNIGTPGVDRAMVVRLERTELTDKAIQAIGTALESYMDQNGVTEFATAAIADIGKDQDLFGRWNTVVFTRDTNGKWHAKNRGFASVAKSTGGAYAVLENGRLAKTDGGTLISTLLDDNKFRELMNGGTKLEGTKRKHLVRAPLDTGAYAVIDDNGQTVYNDDLEVVATGKTPFLVMPSINEDGDYVDGHVTTVSGQGNTWDVRRGIPATKADGLGQAYGAQTA